ncbi:Exo_endo_phos domain-containing protein [Gossypium australe]|uniref:Exo_endo_phos domain-containing protein n=1 Tax=Gossypium australe TaxID=47621 RepID=A0A5B6WRC7_9ROSI|nr:Exo_endo_phos domain-containing protein [Gossypium australe]
MEDVRRKCGFDNSIDVGPIGSNGRILWRFMSFYGNPEERYRSLSWDLLRQLSHDQMIPWLVVGDFNEIAFSFNMKGGRFISKRWFTWERGRLASNNIMERLDWGAVNLA